MDWKRALIKQEQIFLKKVTLESNSRKNNSTSHFLKQLVSEEFLNQMVETLGIIIDRRPKGRPRERKS